MLLKLNAFLLLSTTLINLWLTNYIVHCNEYCFKVKYINKRKKFNIYFKLARLGSESQEKKLNISALGWKWSLDIIVTRKTLHLDSMRGTVEKAAIHREISELVVCNSAHLHPDLQFMQERKISNDLENCCCVVSEVNKMLWDDNTTLFAELVNGCAQSENVVASQLKKPVVGSQHNVTDGTFGYTVSLEDLFIRLENLLIFLFRQMLSDPLMFPECSVLFQIPLPTVFPLQTFIQCLLPKPTTHVFSVADWQVLFLSVADSLWVSSVSLQEANSPLLSSPLSECWEAADG